jgi:hypothetical protein
MPRLSKAAEAVVDELGPLALKRYAALDQELVSWAELHREVIDFRTVAGTIAFCHVQIAYHLLLRGMKPATARKALVAAIEDLP